MRSLVALVGLFVMLVPATRAQEASSIRGVWILTEIEVEGGRFAGLHTDDVQPGMMILTERFFSGIRVPTALADFRPRPLLRASASDDQRLAAFDTFFAGTGVYEWDGSTLTRYPLVARAPNRMTPGFTDQRSVRVEGDTLILVFDGGPGWEGARRTALKFTRAPDLGQHPLDGVWKKVAVRFDEVPVPFPGNFQFDPQPDYLVVLNGHYSRILVRGTAPRPLLAAPSTGPERLAAFDFAFNANAGHFDFDGSTFTRRPLVAKDPNEMVAGHAVEHDARLEGDTLWISWRAPTAFGVDKYVRVEPFAGDE